jgi:penicillin G amidase
MTQPPGDDTQYMWNGTYVPYAVRNEVVKVRGQADEVVRVRVSAYGPVVTDNGLVKDLNTPLSLRWITIDPTIPDTTLDAFLGLQRAANWSDFRGALARYIAPSQNFVYADTAGNIGYQMSGAVPQRNPAAGYTGAWPSPGDGNATYMWGPRVPYDDMPRTYNPPEGFVATANNRVVPPSYPYLLTADWDEGSDGYRAQVRAAASRCPLSSRPPPPSNP